MPNRSSRAISHGRFVRGVTKFAVPADTVIEAGGSRRRSALVAGMCAVTGRVLRRRTPDPGDAELVRAHRPIPGMIATSSISSGVAIDALVRSGLNAHGRSRSVASVRRHHQDGAFGVQDNGG